MFLLIRVWMMDANYKNNLKTGNLPVINAIAVEYRNMLSVFPVPCRVVMVTSMHIPASYHTLYGIALVGF